MSVPIQHPNPRRPYLLKLSRNQVQSKTHALPRLRFEDQRLTSFAGLLLFQSLFAKLQLVERLRRGARHLQGAKAYGLAKVILLLIVHLLLGFRSLREIRFYRDDPMVLRLLGLHSLPDVATLSRTLAQAGTQAVERMRCLCRSLVVERLDLLNLRRLTLDFDGSVLGTARAAEGTAVGYNKKKKGQRSYYPLFCTLAQTGQVFDVLHRPGNVHDSRGAREFVAECVEALRKLLPSVVIEVRMDSAFFSDAMLRQLERLGVEFSISAPFARFTDLKQIIERRHHWHRLNSEVSYFELRWKPRSWKHPYRFLVVRTHTRQRSKEPIQLDLFIPYVEGFHFQVVVTNKTLSARHAVAFHNGRGAQEAIFGEMKSQGQLDYVPTRTLVGNQIYLLCVLLAHNLQRELQMRVRAPQRTTTEKRAPLWRFHRLDTLRRTLVQRAGRLTRPQGRLTLTLSANPAVRKELLHCLDTLQQAA